MTTSTSYKRKGNALVTSDCSFIACSNGMLLLGNHCTQTSYLEDCVSIAGIMSPRWVVRHNVSFMLLHH